MITIRPYFDSDWDAVCQVHDRAQPGEFLTLGDRYPLISLAKNQNICKLFKGCYRFVACHQGKVVGVIASYERYIVLLYTDPDYQSQGIGKRLLNVIIHIIGSPLWTVVIAENHRARQFYQRQGFEESHIFTGDISGVPCQFVRLKR